LNFTPQPSSLMFSDKSFLVAVYWKSGGMTHIIYTKLYNSMVEPVLMHGSGIWGAKSYNVINSVQNKACKYFSSVGKNTSPYFRNSSGFFHPN
jgi:hypothetical protein